MSAVEGKDVEHRRAWIVVVGWACLWSWPYATFMAPSLGVARAGTPVDSLLWTLSLLVQCAMCVAMGVLERRLEAELPRMAPALAATAGLAASCVAMAACRAQAGAPFFALGVVGAAASGVCGGYLLVAWQWLLSTLSLNEIDAGIPMGYGLSLALGAIGAVAGPLAGTALTACLICLSACSFSMGLPSADAAPEHPALHAGTGPDTPAPTPAPARGVVSWLCTAATIISILVPVMFVEASVVPARDMSNPAFMASTLCGALVAALFGYVVYRRAVRIDLALAMRVCVPLTLASMLVLCLAPARVAFVAQILGFAANTLLHMHLHVAAATLTKLGKAGACRASAGFLMPLYLAMAVSTSLQAGLDGLEVAQACLLSVAVMLVAGLYLAPLGVGYRSLGMRIGADAHDALMEEPVPVAPEPSPQVVRPAQVIAERYGLTKREREVLEPFVAGRDSGWIREQLGISRDTVNTHLKHIYAKVGIHSKRELLDLAEELEAHATAGK